MAICGYEREQCFLEIVMRNDSSLYQPLPERRSLFETNRCQLSLLKIEFGFLFIINKCQESSFCMCFDSLQDTEECTLFYYTYSDHHPCPSLSLQFSLQFSFF